MIKLTRVELIEYKIAKPFVETWHYSGVVPTGKNTFFGWYTNEGTSLYAVANYGVGVNPYQASSLAKLTGLPVADDNLVELKRLCRTEPKIDELPLTYFIAKCNKILKQMGVKYVVSFSDPMHNHSGGIYKASNFKHLGKTSVERHVVDTAGNVRHRRYYYRYAKRNNVSMEQARRELGLTVMKTEPKDRWFIVL